MRANGGDTGTSRTEADTGREDVSREKVRGELRRTDRTVDEMMR